VLNEYEDMLQGDKTPTGNNEYFELLNEGNESQKQALKQSMAVASRTQPDRRVEVLKLSEKMNLPPNIVERQFDAVSKKANQTTDYDAIIKKTPGLAKWLENPDNAAIGRDDLDQLGKIDEGSRRFILKKDEPGMLSDLSQSGQTGWNQLGSSAFHLAAAYGLMSPQDAAQAVADRNKRSQDLRAKMPDYAKEFSASMEKEGGDINKAFNQFTGSFDSFREGKILEALKDFAVGGGTTIGETLDMIGAAAVRPKGLTYTTVENLANSLPALTLGFGMMKGGAAIGGAVGAGAGAVTGPGAAVTGTAGAVVGGTAGLVTGTFLGSSATEIGAQINDSLQKRGVDITDANQILAAYSDPQLMAQVRGEAERKGITTAAVDALFSAVAGRFIKAGKPGVVGKTVAGAKDVGVQAVGEAGSEFAGQLAREKGDLSKMNIGEAIQEGIISLGHSAGDSVIGASRRAVFDKNPAKAAEQISADTSKAMEAQNAAQSLSEIAQAVKESKVAKRMPEKIRDLVEAATGGQEASAVYFQADDWDSYWTQRGKSPAKAAEQILGDGGQAYMQAKETGAQLEIPLAEYVAKVAPTEDFDGLLPMARTKADGMTLAEAQEHLQSLPATMEELAKEASAPPMEEIQQQSAAKVSDVVTEQLKSAGFDEKTASTYSKLYERAFSTLGQRAGVNPLELFERYGLKINSQEQTQVQPGETALNQSRKGGAVQAVERKGYTISHDEIPSNSGDFGKGGVVVRAYDSSGNEVGDALIYVEDKRTLFPRDVNVDENHRRQGLASAMYEYAEKIKKRKLRPSGDQTSEAQKLWSQPNRPFGNRAQPGEKALNQGPAKSSKSALKKLSQSWRDGKVDDRTSLHQLAMTPEFKEGRTSMLEALANDTETEVINGVRHFKLFRAVHPNASENYKAKALSFTTEEDVADNFADEFGANVKTEWIPEGNISFAYNHTKHLGLKTPFSPEYEVIAGPSEDTFNQGDSSNPRGQIRFGKNGINIDILKTADLSTFLHETGHFYLEILGDLAQAENATQEVRDDYATVLKWLGVESRDQIQVQHHEQWARGFEAYLMEGKAPTTALRTAFAKFRVWLTSVYRQIRNLNVELTPEVRNVMNRMLATDEEISQAQAEQGMEPLFGDPKTFGMTGAKAEAYVRATQEARQAAEEEVSSKLIADFKREKEAWWKERREGVRAEIAAQVNESRVYKAIAQLRDGTQPDGSPMKISRESIIQDFGDQFIKRLPQRVVAAKAKGGGLHHNIVAEMFGFESGDAMLTEMANAPKKDDLIDKLTDARMGELYPDLLVNGALEQEAMKAVHNDKRAQVLRLELEHLASNDMPVLKEMIRRVARRVPSEKIVREQAARIIGSRKVKDIQPHLYQRAEAKAAKQAGEALAKGDFDAAFEAKQRELLNHELYRAAVDVKEGIEAAVEKFKKLNQKDEKLAKSRDMDLVNAARAILAQFGLGKTDKPASAYLEQIKQYDPEAYQTIEALVLSATERVNNYKEISFDDFTAMHDAVMALWDLSKTSQQMVIDGRIMDRDQVKMELEARLDDITKAGNRAGYDRARTKWDEAKMYLMGIKASLRRVESWVDAMDGGDYKGAFRKYIFNPVSEAVTQYRGAKANYLSRYLEIVKAVEPGLTKKEIKATEIGYTFSGKAELLGALLHTGNESNLAKLLKGRGWGDQNLDGSLDRRRWDAFINRMHAEGVLTKADYDYAQAVWDLLEEIKPQAQQAHKQMYGHYFGEISAQEFATPFGSYRGGYVPAIADPFVAQDAAIRGEKELLEKFNNSFMFPTAGRGFTKKRVEAYSAPLLLDLKFIPGHIDKVLRFVHIEPQVKSVGRLVMDRSFRKSLDAFDPTVGGDMLVPWLQRSAQQKVSTPSQGWGGKAADRFFGELRRRTGLQAMFGNVVNTLQNVTGFSIAAVKVKPRHLRNALWDYVKAPRQVAEDVTEKSAFMKARTSSQVMEIQQSIDEMILNPTKYERAFEFAKKHGYFMQSATQNVIDFTVWTGAYNQAIEKGASEVDAVREADSVVRQTQGSMNAEDISRFETGTPFMRAFTMFYSYFNMQANLLGTEFVKVQRETGLRKGAGRLVYVYAMGFMIPAVLAELIVKSMSGKGMDEDDDDQHLDDFMATFFVSQVRSGTALFPVVGPSIQAGINATNDKWYDDRISTSPAVSMIESAVSAPASVYKAVADDGNRKRAIRDTLSLVGLLTGLPVAPVARPLGYLSDVADDKAEPDGPVDFARGLVTGKAGD